MTGTPCMLLFICEINFHESKISEINSSNELVSLCVLNKGHYPFSHQFLLPVSFTFLCVCWRCCLGFPFALAWPLSLSLFSMIDDWQRVSFFPSRLHCPPVDTANAVLLLFASAVTSMTVMKALERFEMVSKIPETVPQSAFDASWPNGWRTM